MEWLRAHPYTSALAAACLLIIAGTFLVATRAARPLAHSQTLAWGGAGAVLNPSYAPGAASPQGPSAGILQQAQNSAPYSYILPTPQTANPDAGAASGDGFDFDAFISLLSSSGGGSASLRNPTGDNGAAGAYAFIPAGLVSPAVAPSRTKLQQSLYVYGNETGSAIESFEQSHPNETQALIDQAQDRADPGKAARVEALGAALSALGEGLLAMDAVPAQALADHTALAESYRDIGTKLALVPQAKSDADFIAAVQSYNASADIFTRKYVALANLFVAYGVRFSQSDPGNVFTFTNASF